MASSSPTNKDAGMDSTPIAQKRKLSEPSNLDRPKKFGRTAKGRKVAREHGKKMRELEAASHDPQQEHPFFALLPTELQDHVLSYLPMRDLALARRSSKKFQRVVVDFETSFAQPTITFHINRLQATIDKLNVTKYPTDADSFLACMRTWTSIRGCFRNPTLSLDSYSKWFSHLSGGRLLTMDGQPEEDFQRWATLATQATMLQRRINELVNQKIDILDVAAGGDDPLWESFSNKALGNNCPLSAGELRKLYEHIRGARGDERAINGRWHTAKKERTTFPSDKTEKMSRGDHARIKRLIKAIKKRSMPRQEGPSPPTDVGRFRLTPILSDLRRKTNELDGLRYPVRPADIMCANLGLPPLPDHNTFCYYVTNAWVFDKLSKSYPDAIVMGPSMRAAALACVEIF